MLNHCLFWKPQLQTELLTRKYLIATGHLVLLLYFFLQTIKEGLYFIPTYLLHHHCSNVIYTLALGEMRREVVGNGLN